MDLLIRAAQTVEVNRDDETVDQRDGLEMEENANQDDEIIDQSGGLEMEEDANQDHETIDQRDGLEMEKFASDLCKFLQAGGCISGGHVRDDPYNPKSQTKRTDASTTKSRKTAAKRRRNMDAGDDNDTEMDRSEPAPPKRKQAKRRKGGTNTASNKSNAAHLHVPPEPKKRKQGPEDNYASRPPPLAYTVYKPALPPDPAPPAHETNGTHIYVSPSPEERKKALEDSSAGRSPALPPARNSLAALAAGSNPLCNSTSRPKLPSCRLHLTPPLSPEDLEKWRREKDNNTSTTIAAANDSVPSSRPKRRSGRVYLTAPHVPEDLEENNTKVKKC
ncbi:MAG: hypothetical protein Q9214_006024, partial [Letrouitia sp. 1 TL-2023]